MAEMIVEPIERYGLNEKNRKRSMFSRIGVVGCGKEGQNIVGIMATSGLEVTFIELSQDKIDYGFTQISRNLDNKIENWGLTAGEKKTVLSRIKGSLDYNDLRGCDFVIECTRYDDDTGTRNIQLRKEVFQNIESVVSEDAIISTNASTIIISELAADLKYKERCISLHFLVSQPEARILEIVKGVFTSDEVFNRVLQFTKLIKFDAISVHECAGLVSLRLFVVMLNEACQMLMENIASIDDIDKLMRLGWGYRLGPFRSADIIGIEKIIALMENLFDEYGDLKYKPSSYLKKLKRAKQYGMREGKGFYIYDENSNVVGPNNN